MQIPKFLAFSTSFLNSLVLACIIPFSISQGTVLALQPPQDSEPNLSAKDLEKQDEPEDDWIKNQPEGARAQFKTPYQPVLKERMFTPVEGRPAIKVFNYLAVSSDDQSVFLFNYHDLHEAPSDTAIEETLKGAMLQSLSNVRGRLIADQPIRYRTNPGKAYEFRFARDKQFYKGLARIFLVGNRHYQIAVMMKEDGFDQAIADKFLNSLRLLEPTKETDKPDEAKSDSNAPTRDESQMKNEKQPEQNQDASNGKGG